MSDLAPFVAATLRDKVLSELLEENRKLREEKHAGEFVEITGPNRQPVYARGHLRDNGRETVNESWSVDMDAEQQLPCPLQDLKDIEIWVRNVKAKMIVTPLDAAVDSRASSSSSPRALLMLGNDYVIIINFDFSQEEQRIIEASAAEAAEANGDDLGLPDWLSLQLETFRVLTEEVAQTDPTKSCTFVSLLLQPNALEL